MANHNELESLGILRQTKVPKDLAWLSDAQKRLLLSLMLAGEGGLLKSKVSKEAKGDEALLIGLEMHSLVTWERDKTGNPAYLVLTWKGEEAAQVLLSIAKNESRRAPKSPE